MPVIGLGLMVQMASTNTVLQTIVEDDKRGRVMGFYAMAFMGMVPLGSLLAGSSRISSAPADCDFRRNLLHHRCRIFATNLPTLRRLARPIYVRKGIILEVAEGLQSATSLPQQ